MKIGKHGSLVIKEMFVPRGQILYTHAGKFFIIFAQDSRIYLNKSCLSNRRRPKCFWHVQQSIEKKRKKKGQLIIIID